MATSLQNRYNGDLTSEKDANLSWPPPPTSQKGRTLTPPTVSAARSRPRYRSLAMGPDHRDYRPLSPRRRVARLFQHRLARLCGFYLLESEAQQGRANTVDLAMSRRDIADYLGLTIETVSRTLLQLDRDGTIGLTTARHVVLKDRRALRALN
jgi:hypothetical protein